MIFVISASLNSNCYCSCLYCRPRLAQLAKAQGRAHPNGHLYWGGLKAFADGSLGSRTALMKEPYSDDPHTSGIRLTPYPDLAALVQEADAAALQVCVLFACAGCVPACPSSAAPSLSLLPCHLPSLPRSALPRPPSLPSLALPVKTCSPLPTCPSRRPWSLSPGPLPPWHCSRTQYHHHHQQLLTACWARQTSAGDSESNHQP